MGVAVGEGGRLVRVDVALGVRVAARPMGVLDARGTIGGSGVASTRQLASIRATIVYASKCVLRAIL